MRSARAGAGAPRPPVVALYATQGADRLLAVHGALAAEGVLAVPARTAAVARALAPVLAPQLLMTDLLLPPRGGLALLAELGDRLAAGARVVVAPERWRVVRRGLPAGVGVLAFPPSAAAVAHVLREVVPAGARSLARLPSPAAAESLLAAVERLLEGERPAVEGAPPEDRPEVALVRTLLGARGAAS